MATRSRKASADPYPFSVLEALEAAKPIRPTKRSASALASLAASRRAADPNQQIIKGIPAMANELRVPARQLEYLVTQGALASVRKLGGRYYTTRGALWRDFGGKAEAI